MDASRSPDTKWARADVVGPKSSVVSVALQGGRRRGRRGKRFRVRIRGNV
jgi:hypothetical protein